MTRRSKSNGAPWSAVKWEDLPKIVEYAEKAKALMAAREKLDAEMRELAEAYGKLTKGGTT